MVLTVQKTYCIVAADIRERLNPPSEKEYFGNVTNIRRGTATVGYLVDHELGWAALRISKVVTSLTDEYYRTHAESLVKNVKIPRYGVGNRMLGDSVAVTNSPWFQVYDNEFG